jgi:hypothetical protein
LLLEDFTVKQKLEFGIRNTEYSAMVKFVFGSRNRSLALKELTHTDAIGAESRDMFELPPSSVPVAWSNMLIISLGNCIMFALGT